MTFLRQKRLVFVFFIFLTCLAGLVFRLWVIQIRDGEIYSCLALNQGSLWVALEETPRGKILDRNLTTITVEKREDRIVIFPGAVRDKAVVWHGLAGILGVDEPVIKKYLEGDACILPYSVSPEQSSAVREKGWVGVMALPVQYRYGERPLASHVLGHLGKISSREEFLTLANNSNKIYRYSDVVGKTGLEKYYEKDLKGMRPQQAVRVYTDARGRLLGGPGFKLEEGVGDRERKDLVLTIDLHIQRVVEDVMDRKVERGAVVVMEAGSGDILAMASRPGFDPANPGQTPGVTAEECFFDRCVSLYQPGSVFKVIVAAAAIEEDVAGLDSRFVCRGEQENMIHCWKEAGHGDLNFATAFAVSCNPVFAETGLALGAPTLIEYAGRLGFDNQSVIGYPAPADQRQDLDLIGAPYNLVNSSVGQGPVLVTPVQIAAMTNVVVSNGIYRTPRLVKEVRKSSGSVAREFPQDTGRIAVSSVTAEKLRKLMELAVDQGTGKAALVPAFGSAGKTGSAQLDSGKDSVNAWFSGYAPRTCPRYIITVLVEGGAGGGETAAPIFREIMERILK